MRRRKLDRAQSIKEAANALSDLNVFAIIVSILEGGHIHTASYDTGARIIKMCKEEQQKRLREYDRAFISADRNVTPAASIKPES